MTNFECRAVFRSVAHFGRATTGNVAVIFSLALPVVLFAIGVGSDFAAASRLHAKLNALADSAALAAVSATAMQDTDTQAATIAQNMFNAQISQLYRVTLDPNQPTITITHPNGPLYRTVNISYVAKSLTIFSAVLGASTIAMQGSSTATSATSPNINYYLLLDNSSSMALPATENGIAQMQALTPQQNGGAGCAFACHEENPNSVPSGFSAQTVGNPCVAGSSGSNCQMIDNYQLARNNSITLRFDEVGAAVTTLMSTAESVQGQTNPPPTYQFAAYSLDSQYQSTLTNVMPLTSSYASGWQTALPNFQLREVYGEDQGCVSTTNGGVTNPCGAGGLTTTNDVTYSDTGYFDTNLSNALTQMAATIPVAGNGTANSTPQEILFFVTDGVEDYVSNGNFIVQALGPNGLSACTTLKNNGVKIAILYTTYFPTPGFWVYDQYVEPVQSTISAKLQTCASTGLFQTAAPGDDLGAALSALFQVATQSAHLTQ